MTNFKYLNLKILDMKSKKFCNIFLSILAENFCLKLINDLFFCINIKLLKKYSYKYTNKMNDKTKLI